MRHKLLLSIIIAAAVSGCTATPEGYPSASSFSGSVNAPAASDEDSGTDPGVQPVFAKRQVLDTVEEAARQLTIVGTVTGQDRGPAEGEIDSWLSARTVSVKVDDVLNEDESLQTVTVFNGMYEWSSDPATSETDPVRLSGPGQPWLEAGDRVLLVLDADPTSRHYDSFGSTGTFRLTDGRVEAAPRSESDAPANPVVAAFVGSTPGEVEKKLAKAD